MHHAELLALVELLDRTSAVGQDGVLLFDAAIRRQATLRLDPGSCSRASP